MIIPILILILCRPQDILLNTTVNNNTIMEPKLVLVDHEAPVDLGENDDDISSEDSFDKVSLTST